MPAYISHTIMARDVYDKIDNKDVNRDYMITFSLGGDLSKYSKCRYDSHHKLLNEFIYNMCDYMKENNLSNDSECLGVLYGHICHFIMDEYIHPLVRKVDKECQKNKKNHTMIELYYDNYLSQKHYNLRLDKHNNKELFKGIIDEKITKLLNETYFKTYNCDNIASYYKFNIWLYKKIRFLYLFSYSLLKRIIGMNSFLNHNKDIDLINKTNEIEYVGYDKKVINKSLDDLYSDSVNEAVKYIKKVKKYLKK